MTTFVIVDVYYLLPNFEVLSLSELRRDGIFLKKRNNNMIEISNGIDLITSHRIGVSFPNFSNVDPAHAKSLSDIFESELFICSQADEICCYEPPITPPVLNSCHKTAFPCAESSQEVTKLVGHFQIKSKSFLHRNLPNKEPTNPLLVLPWYRADGQRIDGLTIYIKDRLPCTNHQDSTKAEICQPRRLE